MIVATVSGAVAALSALASVLLAVYLWRVNNRPELVVLLEITSPKGHSEVLRSTEPRVAISVSNEGGRLARQIAVWPENNDAWLRHPSVETFSQRKKAILRPGERWLVATVGSEWQVKTHLDQIGPLCVVTTCLGCRETRFELDPAELWL